MSNLIQRYGKTLIIAAVTVLAVAAMAVGGAAALGTPGPTTPPTPGALSSLRLEVAWARLKAGHDRAAVMFQFAEQRTAEVQSLIDQAKASGKDVTDLQAAFDKFESALQQAQPIFDETTSTFGSHPGFDSSGTVIDSAAALQTVTDLAAKDKQIQAIVSPAQQAFQQAMLAFRQSGGAAPKTATASDLRIELSWARLQAAHARLQAIFDFADQRTAEAQQLIDRANASGKDVSSIQSSLDDLKAAIKQAQPVFESASGLIAAHPGFDAAGNVTDQDRAQQTVKNLDSTLQQVGSFLKPAQQAWQRAVQQFRQQNVPVQASPTPGT